MPTKQTSATRSARRLENVVRAEAKQLNKYLIEKVAGELPYGPFENVLPEIALQIQKSTLDVLILGYAIGRRYVKNTIGLDENSGLQLSIEGRIERLIEPEEYRVMQVLFEVESSRWGRYVRADMSDLLLTLSKHIQRSDYTAEQARKALQIVFKERGYNPATARNILNTFTTVYYSGVNGAVWVETHRSPEVWGYRYLNPVDERSRETHAANNGVTLPKEDPFWLSWWPPNGYNCRCGVQVLTKVSEIVEPARGIEPDPGFAENRFHNAL